MTIENNLFVLPKAPLFLLFPALILGSCMRIDFYEKNKAIPHQQWSRKFLIKDSFDIKDTSVPYDYHIVLRHTDAYKFNNIWLEFSLQAPGDTMKTFKLDLSLGNDAQGWDGTGMNDIWEVRKKLNEYPLLLKTPGCYRYTIRHIMRDDHLNDVISVGLRVEKASK